MKKLLKVLGITLLAVVAIIVSYIVLCGSVANEISKLPNTTPAQFVTDFTLLEENSYEISEGDISMRIPTRYATTNLRDYYLIAGESKEKDTILIYYKSMRYVCDTLGMQQDFADYMEAINYFEENKPGYPVNLIFDVPEDLFEIYKKVGTADKHNYKFWNLASALETSYYLSARQEMEHLGLNIHAIYERDDVRAIVATTPEVDDYYVVMLLPKTNAENIYLFGAQTSDLDEIIKMLNTFEYTTGLGF